MWRYCEISYCRNKKNIDLSHALPTEWAHLSAGQVSIFNPTLYDDGANLVIAYRVVGLVDELRRIATAKLDNDFQIIPGSAVPFSDLIEFANPDELDENSKTWFADPRFFRLNNSVWLMWNNGHVDEVNKQFLIEVSADGLRPIGKAREIVLTGGRRKTEKNWSFFENSEGVFAVYSVTPHRIIQADLSSTAEIKCHLVSEIDWSAKYSELYGAFRGGAGPIQIGDKFLNLAHSSYGMPAGREYVPAVYEFEAKYPFRPTDELVTPIFVPDVKHKTEEETEESLNPGTSRVVYPSGAILRGDDLIFSIGINDHEMGISRTSLSAIQAASQPVSSVRVAAYDYANTERPFSPNVEIPQTPSVPVFWWDATGAVMSPLSRNWKFNHGNFGDEASHELIDLLGPIKARKVLPGDVKLLAIGSILHRMEPGEIRGKSGKKERDETQEAARIVFDSTGEGIEVEVNEPSTRIGDADKPFRPTSLMEKASKALELSYDGLTQDALAKEIGGRRQYALEAAVLLIAENYVEVAEASGKKIHRSLAQYRQASDPLSDHYVGGES